jgi:hypothetical protein
LLSIWLSLAAALVAQVTAVVAVQEVTVHLSWVKTLVVALLLKQFLFLP